MNRLVLTALVVVLLGAACGSNSYAQEELDAAVATAVADALAATSTTAAESAASAATTEAVVATTTTAAPTTTTQATTTTEYVLTDEDIETLYASVVRGIVQPQYPAFAAVSDEHIIDMGYNICDVVTEAKIGGTSPGDTALMLVFLTMEAFDPDEMGVTIAGTALGAAPEAFCPEHLGYVEDMIDYALNF